MVFFNMKSLLAITAVSLANLPSTLAWTNRIMAPATAHPGENITVTIETSIYIQNEEEFGIVWGLATPETANYTGQIGTRIGYTDLKGPTAPEVPPSGNYSVRVALPESTQGDMVLIAAITHLVGASGSVSVRFFPASITISA